MRLAKAASKKSPCAMDLPKLSFCSGQYLRTGQREKCDALHKARTERAESGNEQAQTDEGEHQREGACQRHGRKSVSQPYAVRHGQYAGEPDAQCRRPMNISQRVHAALLMQQDEAQCAAERDRQSTGG